jgi:molybdopterin-containing oxidoreductase family iron-sulfur binding subunit
LFGVPSVKAAKGTQNTEVGNMVDDNKTEKKPGLATGSHGVNMAAWTRLPVHDENFNEPSGFDRRDALKVMGASAAVALGLPGCKRKPMRKIVSRVDLPEYQKPGKVLEYSSTWTDGAYPYGTIVKVVDNRPIKIEGNPDHPVNAGSSSAQMQASILGLYDPDRMRGPKRAGQATDWESVDKDIAAVLGSASSVVLLTGASLGPAERSLIDTFLKSTPGARHFVYEPVHDGPRRRAWRDIFGSDGELIADYSKADIIVSLEADFLGTEPRTLESTRQYAGRRNPDENNNKLNRLWVVESAMTTTGSNADVRLRLKPSACLELVSALRAALGGDAAALTALCGKQHLDKAVVAGLVEDLKHHHGASVVVAGGHLPESVHAAVALLNKEIDAYGNTLSWNATPSSLAAGKTDEIAAALNAGPDVVICLGVNPVYSWPGGGFDSLLKKAGLTVGHGIYENETLAACNIALPSHHSLESWNDAIAGFGVESICQPALYPLWDTRQEAASLLKWTQAVTDDKKVKKVRDWHDAVQSLWTSRHSGSWIDSLKKGVGIRDADRDVPNLSKNDAQTLIAEGAGQDGGFELVVWPDGMIHDGRFANLSWLQETPDPVTRLVWDNAAMMSPATAAELNVGEGQLASGDTVGDTVTLSANGNSVSVGVLVVPGMADKVIATSAGYGRTAGGEVGKGLGRNVFPLVNGSRLVRSIGVTKGSERYSLVRTQKYMKMRGTDPVEAEERPIALDGTVEEYKAYKQSHGDKGFVDATHRRHMPPQVDIYEGHDYTAGPRWHMAIDMSKCTGCSGCVTACQAENNIPVVGKEECANGREMSWMRIDRYHSGEDENPKVHTQPMLCQHCENAPCENVCPVNATTHSVDGLNEMVYNRCVGTRYCANNCPYKVRRFNFYDYTKQTQPQPVQKIREPKQQLLYNPQVTVRMRGVMEKCTFCVQRINAGKFAAKNAGEAIADGAVQTACQQSCPAGAISFGNINNEKSEVSQQAKSDLKYFVLEELNVKPSISYLARMRNPHPAAPGAATGHDEHAGDHG